MSLFFFPKLKSNKVTTQLKGFVIKFIFLLIALYFLSGILYGQTPGLIFKPAASPGNTVLNPNGDGYTSSSATGFISNDKTESEIPYVPMAFPMLEPTGDLGPGPDCSFTDFVDSGVEDPALSYFDGTNLLFRIRLGKALPNSKGYSILIDTDQKFGLSGVNADLNATTTNPGFEIEINLQTNFGVFVYNVDGVCAGAPSSSFAGETNYQKSIALSTNCGDPDYFYDFYVPFSALTALGINSSTPLRMAIITQMNPQPAVCNNALSDFGGVDDALYGNNPGSIWTAIVDNFPPTSVVGLNTPLGDRSLCPVITGPIPANATSVSGTSTEATGTSINVFKNAALIGTTSVSAGTWTLSSIAPALIGGDIITATATAPSESESIANCNPVTVAVTCSALPPNATMDAKGVCGTGAVVGALIRVYRNGVIVSPNSTGSAGASGNAVTVQPGGTWRWKCNTNTNCNGGANCITDGYYTFTQQVSGQCESVQGLGTCFGAAITTIAPAITTSPILTTTTSVLGSSASGATIYLYADGIQIGTATAIATNWTISSLSLSSGQVITAKAILSNQCLSVASPSVTVTRNTVAPVVAGTYCTATTITSVSGTSTEAAGTVIQVFKNGVAHGSTTTVLANGTWTASTGISFAASDAISAKATVSGGIQSAFSNSISVEGKTTTAVSITTSPILEGATSVAGTGTNGNVIRLYADGFQIGGTATVAGGTWMISGLGAFDLYAGGVITATATSAGNCESNPSASVVVQCIAPLASLIVNPDNAVVCSGSIIINAQVVASQSLVVYQLYNGASASGSSVLGTGGIISLNSGTLTANTTLTVKAIKIGGITCESTLAENIPVTVNANPTTSLTVAAAASPICQNTSTTIDVQNSQSGFTYQLRNNVGNVIIGSSVAGTGGTIALPTGNLSANTIFNVLVTGVAPSLCSAVLTTLPTVTITTPLSATISYSGAPFCSSLAIPQSVTLTGTTGGTFSSTAGLTINTSTGAITPSTSMASLYTVTYSIAASGGCPIFNTTTDITISIAACGNVAPVASNDIGSTNEDTSVTILDVTGNDTDADGTVVASTVDLDPITAGIQTTFSNAGGAWSVNASGDVTYTPTSNFNGLASITYTVNDNTGATSNTATITLTVSAVNDEPSFVKGPNQIVNEDAGAQTVTAWATAINKGAADESGQTLTFTLTNTNNALFLVQPSIDPISGNLIYTPDANAFGTATISIVLTDDGGTANGGDDTFTTQTFTVTVNSVNDEPSFVKGANLTIDENAGVQTVSAWATSINKGSFNETAQTLTFFLTNDNNALFTVQPSIDPVTGNLTYTPALNASGIATISIILSDNGGTANGGDDTFSIQTFTIRVDDEAIYTTAPAQNINSYSNGNTLATVADTDGAITNAVVSSGTLPAGTSINATTGAITVTDKTLLVANTYTFDVTTTDATGGTTTQTVSLTFTADIEAIYTTAPAQNINSYSNGNTLATVTDADGAITSAVVSSGTLPAGTSINATTGEITVTDKTLLVANTYTFDVTTTDATGGTTTQTVSLTFTADIEAVYTTAPAQNINSYSNGNTLATVADVDGPITSAIISSGTLPAGTSINASTGEITVTDKTLLVANTYTFDVTTTDATGGTTTQTVILSFTNSNSAPVAVNDAPTTNEDTPITFSATSNDTDADGTINVASVDLNPATAGIQNTFANAQGNWSVDALGNVTFTPVLNFNGVASITYTVNDNTGAVSNAGMIAVTVSSVNDAPVAVNDSGSTGINTATTINVVTNDTDADGTINIASVDMDPTTVGIQTSLSTVQGTWSVDNTGIVTFMPALNFTGLASISYTVNDSGGAASTIATITINVAGNITPVAVNDSPITNEDTPVTFSLTANDTDADGTIDVTTVDLDPSTTGVQSTFTNAQGIWSVDALGNVTFTPALNYNGTASITYTVKDNSGAISNAATITVTVNAVNDAPVLTNIFLTIIENNPVSGSMLLSSDVDPDGTVLTVNTIPVNGPSNGTIVIQADGTYTYTPNLNFIGMDVITVQVCDGGLPLPKLCATKTITIFVNPIGLKPELGFSPNGDGNNEAWIIRDIERYPNNVVKVFNRWGNLVYETASYNNNDNAWAGQSNGQFTIGELKVTDGTYFYVIDLGDGSKAIGGYLIIKR